MPPFSKINYSDVDEECLEIIKALNRLPGIETDECCCGHGKDNFMVFFHQKDNCPATGLAILGKIMSRRYYGFMNWTIKLDEISDKYSVGSFTLEGPIGEQGYTESRNMALVINRILDTKEWPYNMED